MSKPDLDAGSLLAYWDDAVSADVRRQIEGNPELMARARQLRSADASLSKVLARATCPTGAELGDYQHGLLDDEENHRIARHAAECPHCARELVQMADFMDEVREDVDPGWLERIKIVVAELLSGPGPSLDLPPSARLAPIGVRGASEDRNWVFAAGDYHVSITARDDASGPGAITLVGLVLGPPPQPDRAELRTPSNDVSPLRITPIDASGNFQLLGLTGDRFRLRLVGDVLRLDLPDLVL